MAATKQEMRDKVLKVLKLLPNGQDADAEHVSIVEDNIDAAQAFLAAEGIAYWATSAIPDGVVQAYRDYVAAKAALELRKDVVTNEAAALADMRSFTATVNGSIRQTYF